MEKITALKKSRRYKRYKRTLASGLTAAMLIGSYSLAVCAAAGFNMLSFAVCAVFCALISINCKKILAPHPYLFVPAIFVLGETNALTLSLSIAAGAFIFLVMKKIIRFKVSHYARSAGGIALALAVTILLTNLYFGIGATGYEALEMLKSYRSLGFHPNFRGLLYGTITLFAMITYPFKFKKLNKYIPAEFITLLIPLILNLFLNPDAELTTINELGGLWEANLSQSGNFFASTISDFKEFFAVSINGKVLIKGALSIAFMLFVYNRRAKSGSRLALANGINGVLTGVPVKAYRTYKYSKASAIIAIATILVSITIFPYFIFRIPVHCIGAMLIVAAWRSVPYKNIGKAFEKNPVLAIFNIAVVCILIVFLGVFPAMLYCFIITFLEETGK